MERVQHRFTRMLPGLKSLQCDDRLKALGIWSLEKRRNRADLLEVYKMKSAFLLHLIHFSQLRYDTMEEFNVDSKAEYKLTA